MSRTQKNATEQVEALRKKITALQLERETLNSQKRSRDEVVTQLDAQLSEWKAAGIRNFTRDLQKSASGQPTDFLAVRGTAFVQAAPGTAPFNLNLGPLLVALLGENVVRAAILRDLKQLPEGLSAGASKARIRAISSELDQLEAQEEALIDASNGALERRPDARPEIILTVN